MTSLNRDILLQKLDLLASRAERAIGELEYSCNPRELYNPIIYALDGGGKRIRPLLLLIGYHLYHNTEHTPQQVIDAALSMEMFHNFTLLHDDIMDNSSVRRGRDTVHVKWGENMAILSGDTMLTYSYKLLCGVEDRHLRQSLEIFNSLAMNIFEGQQYDMMFESRESVAIEEYIEMIRLKTAVLLSGSIKIGALLADAPEEDITLLDEFAENLGLAFQLQDDMLDTFGDTKTFGKEVGGDIVSAKKTFLLINLLGRASSEDREVIDAMLKSEEMNRAEKLALAKEMFVKYNVDQDIEIAIESYFTKALEAIEHLSCNNESKELLKVIASKLVNRVK